MTEEQLQQRREELRKNREERRILLKRRRRRKMRQTLLCVFLLGLTVFSAIWFIRFPSRYEAKQLEKLTREKKRVAALVSEDSKQSEEGTTNSDAVDAMVTSETTSEAEEASSASVQSNYSQYGGFVAENSSRYDTYKNSTGFSDYEVIWRVNARLDLNLFTDAVTINTNKLNNDILVVVNKYHRVPDGYMPPDLTYNSDGCQLRSATANAFDQMKQAAAASGLILRAVSAYRSVEYQRNLYNSYLQGDSQANVDTYSARAGHSEHHTGMAVDVFGSVDGLNAFFSTPEYQWVKQHGHEYGFIIRYTAPEEDVTGYMDEPWHLRYIGVEHATAMVTQGITTLEEYVGRNGTLE